MNEHEQEISRKVVAQWKATQTEGKRIETRRGDSWGRFALAGALVFGIGVPYLAFKDGLPHGHGSGSDFANGFVPLLVPVFAFFGACVGALLGLTVKILAFLIAKVRKRRL